MKSKRFSLMIVWFISLALGVSLAALVPSIPVQSQVVEIR